MVTGLSNSLLGAWYAARAATSLAGQAGGASAAPRPGQPQPGRTSAGEEVTPPWDPRGEIAAIDALRRQVLADGTFFDQRFGEFASLDVGTDEKTLFALYKGLRRLQSVAAGALERGASDIDRSFLDRRFQEGLEQMAGFFDTMELEGVSVLRGEELSRAESALAISRGASTYLGAVVHSGPFDAEVDAFQGDVRFSMTVRKNGVDQVLDFDLAELGGAPRTLDNVAGYINGKLEAAGMITRVERAKIGTPDANGIVPGDDFGFRVEGVITERVSFASAGAAPAVYMAGISGDRDDAAGQLTKYVDLATGGAAAFVRRIEADPDVIESEGPDGETRTSEASNPLRVTATAASADGGIYVVGETSAAVDGQAIKGERDLVLMRYDSTGKRVWSRVLGAAEDAAGASVAVNAAGEVVVVGRIRGELSGSTDVGGSDSLVVKFDADGVEQWARRFGGTADDQAFSASIAADGTVFVAGQARSAFGGTASGGGLDGYVRALDADGATLYTRRVGATPGAESVKATAIAADGGLLTASEEDGRAVLRKFAAGDDGTGAPVWSLDLGDLDGGRIGGLAVDETGAIFLAGAAGAGFAPSAPVTANAGGRDAMVVRVQDGASPSVAWTSFTGSAEDDSAAGVAAAGGRVYLTGKTSGALPGVDKIGARNAFAAGFDAGSGALQWAQQLSGRGGLAEGAGIAVDPSGDGALDRLGLPSGALVYADSRAVTDRSAVREGDHFYLSVDGGRRRRITVEAGDTMRSLSFKVNAALVLDGRADVRRGSGGDQLRITPREGVTVEFLPGAEGADALSGLGLPAGSVTGKPPAGDADEASADAPKIFALELPTRLDVESEDAAKAANEALTAAMAKVQRAYRELTTDPALRELLEGPQNGKRGGVAPAYLTARISNYQAGLDRLLSGGGGGGGGGAGLLL